MGPGPGSITDFGQVGYRSTATTTFVLVGFNITSGFDVIRLDQEIALTAANFLL